MLSSDWFRIETARQKIDLLPDHLQTLLASPEMHGLPPERPGRDVQILDIKLHPPKAGLQKQEGQIRLLHDLANIELQAMELAVRTLTEFPEAPDSFRSELAEIALEEGRHLKLCLDGLEELGSAWGIFPVNCSLWDSVALEPSTTRGDFLGRIMLVHRYMEATGLDAGAKILTRLESAGNAKLVRSVIEAIVQEEIGHVSFGSRWYRNVCEQNGIDAHEHFKKAYPEILKRVPRTEKPAFHLRTLAGFDSFENEYVAEVLARTDFKTPRSITL